MAIASPLIVSDFLAKAAATEALGTSKEVFPSYLQVFVALSMLLASIQIKHSHSYKCPKYILVEKQ